MTFDDAVALVLGHEGGYVDHPSDPGGKTKYGISQRAYPHLDIARLTVDDAIAIYRRDYWDRMRMDVLPDVVRADLFDTAVNSGPGTAARLLQRAVGVAEDGVIGAVTLAAVARFEPARLRARFNAVRLRFLTDLTTWSTFGRGWARRIAANLAEV